MRTFIFAVVLLLAACATNAPKTQLATAELAFQEVVSQFIDAVDAGEITDRDTIEDFKLLANTTKAMIDGTWASLGRDPTAPISTQLRVIQERIRELRKKREQAHVLNGQYSPGYGDSNWAGSYALSNCGVAA